MPPKKEKKDQFRGDQASEMVLDYLIQQNRPYSAADISANLHNAVTKATAAKVLKELHEKGEIECRVSGKQVVYHPFQDSNDNTTEEEMKRMDQELDDTRNETTALKTRLKEIQSSLSTLRGAPTLAELTESINNLGMEIENLETSLAECQQTTDVPVDLRQRDIDEAQHVEMEKLLIRRRKQFKDFWYLVSDNYEGDRGELWVGGRQ